jgi:membrane associated rhomboid family serine protease
VALFALWGTVLWDVLPGAAGISWQGHLFGAVGGVIAAYLVARADRTYGDRRPQPRLTRS